MHWITPKSPWIQLGQSHTHTYVTTGGSHFSTFALSVHCAIFKLQALWIFELQDILRQTTSRFKAKDQISKCISVLFYYQPFPRYLQYFIFPLAAMISFNIFFHFCILKCQNSTKYFVWIAQGTHTISLAGDQTYTIARIYKVDT